MKDLFKTGKKIFTEPQSSVLSAATVIMFMIVVAQVLGVVRQRVLLHYFTPTEYSLFLAAFRLPDLLFEVLAFGAFSAAFIPVFTKTLKKGESEAWDVASRVVNLGLIFFGVFAIIFGFFSVSFYRLVTPGYSQEEITKIAGLARILFTAQGIFIVSYVITGVLESLRRFLVPALAPIFYNLGIIIGTLIFVPEFGLIAPAIGVVIGAFLHLFVQLPVAIKFGFRFKTHIKPTPEVVHIGKLAAPRVLELSFLQVLKTVELSFASLISSASYTYLTLANSLQIFPVSLLGVSLSKAALPTLTRQADEPTEFKKTFLATLYQMMFLILPIATILIVLRIPIVRLVYGTDIFDWKATVQTGWVLSAFAIGIPMQAALTLLSRAFYAIHDTKTPVVLSMIDVALTILIEIPLILVFHLPVWSIALANSIAVFIQVVTLYSLLSRKLNNGSLFAVSPILKSLVSACSMGIVMFMILKFFDRSVWVKRLSFLSTLEATKNLNFQAFVLDTRYTFNLVILTGITLFVGGMVYLTMSYILKVEELPVLINILRKRAFKAPDKKEVEPLTSAS